MSKIKYPLPISSKLVAIAKKNNLLCYHTMKKNEGKYICVDVLEDGYSIPPTASVIDDLETAQRAADAHNRYLGYNNIEANRFIAKSMGLKTSDND